MTKIHECECGFEWEHGKSGSHWCSTGYKEQITKLRDYNLALATEVEELKLRNGELENTAIHAAALPTRDEATRFVSGVIDMEHNGIAAIKAAAIQEYTENMTVLFKEAQIKSENGLSMMLSFAIKTSKSFGESLTKQAKAG